MLISKLHAFIGKILTERSGHMMEVCSYIGDRIVILIHGNPECVAVVFAKVCDSYPYYTFVTEEMHRLYPEYFKEDVEVAKKKHQTLSYEVWRANIINSIVIRLTNDL